MAGDIRENGLPNHITFIGRKEMSLRYGENPDQDAALYITDKKSPLAHLARLDGKDASATNITDIAAGIESVRLFGDEIATVVVKHGSPCGIALGDTPAQALARAIESDKTSAFGGVVVSNHALDLEAVEVIAGFKGDTKGNMDIIAAPQISDEAVARIREIRPNGRTGVWSFGELTSNPRPSIKWMDGAFIAQTPQPDFEETRKDWTIPTKTKPTKAQLKQMEVAWKFLLRIRSNAVIVVDANLPMTRGIGTGQTSRVLSTEIALEHAGKDAKGAILASDSFFPFEDSVKLAAKHGIGAIIQQGMSERDQLSIDAANEAGIPMVFTHHRAFWH